MTDDSLVFSCKELKSQFFSRFFVLAQAFTTLKYLSITDPKNYKMTKSKTDIKR